MAITPLSTAEIGLKGDESFLDCVVIHSHNLTVFSCFPCAKIRVFKNDGGAMHVFEKHPQPAFVARIVRLFDDVLCSIDVLGTLFTWHASSGVVLGSCKLHQCYLVTLLKLNDEELAVISGDNRIRILKHAKGCNIEQSREIIVSDIDRISDMDGCGNTVAAVGENGKCEIWNPSTEVRTASFKIAQGVVLVRMSNDYIICGRKRNGIIDVYANDAGYGLLQSIDLKQYFVQQGKTDTHNI